MQKHRIRWGWLIGCIAVMLLASGCFQQDGTGAQPVAVEFGPTFTPFPTNTLEPTPLPTEPPDFAPTETPQALEAPPLDGQDGLSVAQLPTTDPALSAPQVQEIDPVFLTATAIIAAATATEAYNLTATAGGFQPLPPTVPVFATTPAPIFQTPVTVVPGGSCVHTVAAGENLFRISLRYNTTIEAIASANGISNPNIVLVGRQLTIPNCTGGTPITVTPGVPGGGTTYTVQQGDTLFQISLRFGVPVVSIANANGIADINRIYINQQLTIPPA